MRVLLIEPDRLLAQAYREALTLAGHHVDHAVAAQQAVSLADAHRPDIVVLELQLPAHNGVEFLYEFRSYPEWLNVPVLVHSFVPPQEYAESQTLTRELGVVRCLYKPSTSLAQLVTAVNACQPAAV